MWLPKPDRDASISQTNKALAATSSKASTFPLSCRCRNNFKKQAEWWMKNEAPGSVKCNFSSGALRRTTGFRGSQLVIPNLPLRKFCQSVFIEQWMEAEPPARCSQETEPWKSNVFSSTNCHYQHKHPSAVLQRTLSESSQTEGGVTVTTGGLRWAPCMHSCYKQMEKQTHSRDPCGQPCFYVMYINLHQLQHVGEKSDRYSNILLT